jgi:hypothetical protein
MQVTETVALREHLVIKGNGFSSTIVKRVSNDLPDSFNHSEQHLFHNRITEELGPKGQNPHLTNYH